MPEVCVDTSVRVLNANIMPTAMRRRSVRLCYLLLLFVITTTLTWSLFRGFHLAVPLVNDEAMNRPNHVPSPSSQGDNASEKEIQENFRQRQHELMQIKLYGSAEGMKTLGHFNSKALLGKRHDLKANWIFNTNYTKPYRPTIPTYQRKYPRVIYFVHIHKSAGTLFCRLAYRNRINTNQASNCNVQDDQYCCGGEDTLKAQISFADRTFWDLVATERELYDSMAPDHYDYVVALRDSKSRYYSHWSHLRRMVPIGPGVQHGGFGDSAWIFGNNTIVDRRIKKRFVPKGMDPLGSFQVWYRRQPDNWNTRVLCGAHCRPQAKYKITRDLFQYTLQRADKFAHFLFVEEMEASYNQMARAYRWHNYSDIANTFLIENHSKRRTDKNGVDLKLKHEKWDPLMSALDDALYEFAKRKYLNYTHEELWKPFRNEAKLVQYFAEGPKFGCRNGCCGTCSSY